MNIYAKGRSRYITSPIDGKDHNLTTGHLDSHRISLADYFTEYEKIERDLCQARVASTGKTAHKNLGS